MNDDDDTCCVICLEDIKKADNKEILKCGHLFHSLCIEAWELNADTCPICRKIVYDDEFIEYVLAPLRDGTYDDLRIYVNLNVPYKGQILYHLPNRDKSFPNPESWVELKRPVRNGEEIPVIVKSQILSKTILEKAYHLKKQKKRNCRLKKICCCLNKIFGNKH